MSSTAKSPGVRKGRVVEGRAFEAKAKETSGSKVPN